MMVFVRVREGYICKRLGGCGVRGMRALCWHESVRIGGDLCFGISGLVWVGVQR